MVVGEHSQNICDKIMIKVNRGYGNTFINYGNFYPLALSLQDAITLQI